MGADRAACSGKSRGCGPLGGGQPAFRRSGSVDCACRGAVARPSRGLRELELGLSALSPMGQGWRVRSDLRDLVGRHGLRVCDRRWHHRPGAPARDRRERRNAQSGHRAVPRRLDDRRAGRCAGQSRAVCSAAGHDNAGVAPLLTDLDFSALLADKAFDSDAIRADLDATAVIPPKANRVTTIPCDFEMYKWRHLVENFFCKLKEFRRIATRYDKTDTSFSAFIQLVGSILATR